MSHFSPISNVVSDVLLKSGFETVAKEKQLQNYWEKIVGNVVAKISKVEYIKYQILYIKVKDDVWRMELNFQQQEILNKVNHFLQQQGEPLLKSIRMK